MDRVVIIGSGAAGLSAAIRLAEENVPSFIVEEMPRGAPSQTWRKAVSMQRLTPWDNMMNRLSMKRKHTKRAAF